MELSGFINRMELLIQSLDLLGPDLLPPSYWDDLLNPLIQNQSNLSFLKHFNDFLQLIDQILPLTESEGEWSDWEFLRRAIIGFMAAEDLIIMRNVAGDPVRIYPRSYENSDQEPSWPNDIGNEAFAIVEKKDGHEMFIRFQTNGSWWYFWLKKSVSQSDDNLLLEILHRFGRWLPALLVHMHAKMMVPTQRRYLKPSKSDNGILGEAPNFLEALESTQRASQSDAPIYLQGESGTGKELFAKRIHRLSKRKDRHFVAINCAAIPHELIESEIFGHEKGAFTGAYYRKIGKAEIADGGTLFLDEVGEMPLPFQAKLLRFLQEKNFSRVGGNSSISSDARIIVATHRNLEERVRSGAFREDLFYRVNVIPIPIPALRHRPGDIRLLAEHFFAKYTEKLSRTIQIESEVFDFLDDYDFPGNVRELENLVHRTVAMSNGPIIQLGDLPPDLLGKRASHINRYTLHPFEGFDQVVPESREELQAYREKVEHLAGSYVRDLERRFLLNILERADGKVRKAAELADINRTLFYKLLKRAGIGVQNINQG